MRSRWHSARDTGEQHPVEMRFIDMFMTALGALVFVALLLVFLLPNVRPPPAPPSVVPPDKSGPTKDYDKDVIRRFFNVLLVTSGCVGDEPTLYVRDESGLRLRNYFTREDAGPVKDFDASDPTSRSMLMESAYYSSEGTLADSVTLRAMRARGEDLELSALRARSARLRLFTSVTGSWTGNGYSVYLVLQNPKLQGNTECIVRPTYFTRTEIGGTLTTVADAIALSEQRPFAWLRRFTIRRDGSSDIATHPGSNAEFIRLLETFSEAQAKRLCDVKSVCNAQDAHLALLKPPLASGTKYQWKSDSGFAPPAFKSAQVTDRKACETMCDGEPSCRAIDYIRTSRFCYLYNAAPKELALPNWERATKEPGTPSIRWQPDLIAVGKGYIEHWTIPRSICEQRCDADGRCQAAEYWSEEKRCILHSSANSTVSMPNRGAALGVKSDTSRTIKWTWGHASSGATSYAIRGAGTRNDCEKLCAEDPQCAAVDYRKAEKQCVLYETFVSMQRSPSGLIDVGVREAAKK